MTDDGVAELYALARETFAGGHNSFQVQSLPFRMTAANMAAHRTNTNMPFWRNLKEGSDYFDVMKRPPTVASCNRRYVFPAESPPALGRFDPLGACPAFETDSAAAPLLAAKRLRDEAEVAQLAPAKAAPTSYVDGGMHPAFRQVLRTEGARRLAEQTSAGIDVSQPEAALSDPYLREANPSAEKILSFSR
jgi:murein L,D-transpeptidase YafK